MKKYYFIIYVLLAFIVFGCKNNHQSNQNHQAPNNSDSVLTVVNWNIEWFGSSENGPVDKALQEANVIKVLKYLHADIYGLCEIVNIAAFKDLVHSLGDNYDFVISDYASGASSTHSKNYGNAQKLAFVYNKNVFSHVSATGFLQDNSAVGYNFSNGRYPYLLSADVTKNGITRHISFFLIHAKSGADASSYLRRKNASIEFKAVLDKDYAPTAMMIFGDFNDELQGSITSEEETSPYKNFIQDNNYAAITLPLEDKGAQSTIDYPSVIDHQIISAILNKMYISGSADIRTDITSVVPDYANGKTSDHYPVSSEYIFSKNGPAVVSSSKIDPPLIDTAQHLIKTFSATIRPIGIDISSTTDKKDIQFVLYNQQDRKIVSVHKKALLAGETFRLRTPSLSAGNYDLVIFSENRKEVLKLTID